MFTIKFNEGDMKVFNNSDSFDEYLFKNNMVCVNDKILSNQSNAILGELV